MIYYLIFVNCIDLNVIQVTSAATLLKCIPDHLQLVSIGRNDSDISIFHTTLCQGMKYTGYEVSLLLIADAVVYLRLEKRNRICVSKDNRLSRVYDTFDEFS